jgi:hypothetical protein
LIKIYSLPQKKQRRYVINKTGVKGLTGSSNGKASTACGGGEKPLIRGGDSSLSFACTVTLLAPFKEELPCPHHSQAGCLAIKSQLEVVVDLRPKMTTNPETSINGTINTMSFIEENLHASSFVQSDSYLHSLFLIFSWSLFSLS